MPNQELALNCYFLVPFKYKQTQILSVYKYLLWLSKHKIGI